MSEFNNDFDADEIINDFKSKFKWPDTSEVNAVVKPPKMGLKVFISLLLTAVIGAAAYYFVLPAINFQSIDIYIFAIVLVLVFMLCVFISTAAFRKMEYRTYVQKKAKAPLILIGIIVGVVAVGILSGATVFRSRSYTKLIDVQTADFQQDFEEINYNEVPRLDKISTKTLADNKLNELSQYVSQFLVASTTTQINYNAAPVRVAPLEYGDFFKWFNNRKNGLPAYMIVDMVTQEVTVVELEEGIKYSPSELFNRKLNRHLRFQYPTLMFDTSNFEINDDGKPFWITAVYSKDIGLFSGTNVKGAIITDAVSGESQYYDIAKVPNWVDRVYSDELVLQQYNYYGKFQRGFINSLIGQKEVKVASAGNGYIAMDDDVWLYTGITSAGSDASNVGFILANQRTKETRYYEIGGAMESGAMASAEGAVQNFGYKASFPILLKVAGEPTYFMSLKDSASMVKQYAMINLKQRTVYGIGNSPEECAESYTKALKDNGISVPDGSDSKPDDEPKLQTTQGAIEEIRSQVVDGSTHYYFKINGEFYAINASSYELAVLFNVGDNVVVEFEKGEGVARISSIKTLGNH